MRGAVSKRLLREEKGFSLVEVMVTMLIMIIVLFALYSIFDMSIKTYSFGNSKAEAMENARLGMDKMEREIRQAYAFDKANGNNQLFPTWDENQLEFGNDLDGSTAVECPNVDEDCEIISYTLDGNGNLMRTSEDPPPVPQAVVENVEDVEFRYFQRNGTTEVLPGGNESLIGMVRIVVDVRVESVAPRDGTQTLTTDVALRNRGN
jgi:prepilin-type N-terminal cleavage/methylation domain-containing protein